MSKNSVKTIRELNNEFETQNKHNLELLRSKFVRLFVKTNLKGVKDLFDSIGNLERNLDYVHAILNVSRHSSLTPRQNSLIELFTYLSIVEGIFSEIVEIIAFSLMQNDHDLYNPRKMEFVDSYEQLKKIDLFVKMQFIEKHGFKFFCDSVDRNLRNSIAHLELKVTDDGSIIDIKNNEKINLGTKIVRLMNVNTFAVEEIAKSAKRGVIESSPK